MTLELNTLERLLLEKPWILADGATGTQLFNMGLVAGDSPEIWNDTQPNKISKLYQDSVNSGVDLFLTNSFGSNSSRLKLHNAENRSFELSKKAAEIARNVADKSDRTIIVAGSMGPTGDLLFPVGDLSYEEAVEIFFTQAKGLKAGGADVLWVETMSDPSEFSAAGEAAGMLGMSWCGTMSFDTAGRTMMGLSSIEMVNFIEKMKYQPIAFGANCGVGAADLLRTIKGFSNSEKPIIAKGNAGIPKYKDGKILYDGTAKLMADYACLARDLGVKIIGGCCGTTPKHLLEMRKALETEPVSKLLPTSATIELKLGGFSSSSDGTSFDDRKIKRVRRRGPKPKDGPVS